MQMLLPIFPQDIKLLTATVGIFTRDGIVNYCHCGVPIFSHTTEDLKSFRYITSKLIIQGLCRKIEISRCFGLSYDSVNRHVNRLREQGDSGFFANDNRRGHCYKLVAEVVNRMQRYLDAGKNNSEIARLEGVSEGSVRYALKKGLLKKKGVEQLSTESKASNRTDRSIKDSSYSNRMGIATSRESDRVAASVGDLQEALPIFEQANNVCHAGVVFMLPALLSQGLLKGKDIYHRLKKGYYGLVSTFLLLAYMSLSRIKAPEQLKTCKVGELGKVLGLDRVPEAKCLRSKIDQIVCQGKAHEFNRSLSRDWIQQEGTLYFYIDGHVRVYHGYGATLTKKYVSREKLCLSGTSEFWLNNELGLPYLVMTGELNEKLKEIINEKIIPALLLDTAGLISEEELAKDARRPRFTIIFDREAYEPNFFKSLWEKHRIAVITYRKAVKDKWAVEDFQNYQTHVIGKAVTMSLAEKRVVLCDMEMREIRKLSDSGHQTSIITTNEQIVTEKVAGKMFSRWSQENFFRYMMQDYDLDKLAEYGVEAINPQKKVVNPSYKKLNYEIKKLREKQNRLKAKFFQIIEKNLENDLEQMKEKIQQQAEFQEKIASYKMQIDEKCKARKQTSYYIELKDMPIDKRYNKLKTESKLFINTIKMIAYRAETAVANLLAPYYKKSENEIRMLVKEIIKSEADLIPDYKNKTLTVRLHSLSTPRANQTAKKLCNFLNETETIYPDTELKLIYKML